MPTANYYVGKDDGWIEVADAPAFVRVSAAPHTHPYYLYAGTSAPSLTAAAATGTVTFSGLPGVENTVNIGSETYTFTESATEPFEVTIGADADETGDNFVTAITADSELVTGSNASGVVTITAMAVGTQGNYALTENADNTAVSGANLTGGADVVEGVLVCRHPFEVNVTMTSEKLFARVPVPVANANKNNGKIRLDVLTIDSA